MESTGEVIHFNSNIELQDVIILKPEVILKAIETSLAAPLKKETLDEKVRLHEQLSERKKLLQLIHNECYERAEKFSHRVLIVGFAGLVFQFYLFGRFTWWDSDWDVMEPITWFTGVVEMVIGGFGYYIYRGSEYSHYGMKTGLLEWSLNRHYRKKDFDKNEFQRIDNELLTLEKEIDFLKRSRELSNCTNE